MNLSDSQLREQEQQLRDGYEHSLYPFFQVPDYKKLYYPEPEGTAIWYQGFNFPEAQPTISGQNDLMQTDPVYPIYSERN